MELRTFQSEALNRILESYNSGKKSALLIMPAGTGKTFLSVHVFKTMINEFQFDSMAYLASHIVMQSAFDKLIQDNLDSTQKKIQSFSYRELSKAINDGIYKPDTFQAVIFDDVIENDQNEIKNIFNFFTAFKVGFSRHELTDRKSIFQADRDGVVYKYSLDQAVSDGYFFSSQKALYKHFFNNLNHRIQNIEVGTDWSTRLRQSFIEQINLIEGENAEYLKAQEILLSGKVKTAEVIELSHRKEQLQEFSRLLNDTEYFDSKLEKNNGVEAVWQNYFEFNPWIFGFGLNFIFNSPLDGKKLEQTVEGYSIAGSGKRTDALLKTTGLIQTLCFGEIKTHRKHILKKTKVPYRPESWAVSDELAGGISQIHKTIQKSLKNITSALSLKDDEGFSSGNPIYLYKPKSFLIIGSLKEFMNSSGDINEEKFSSFELFRRSISDIEIITFDELYERAHAIVHKKWNKAGSNRVDGSAIAK